MCYTVTITRKVRNDRMIWGILSLLGALFAVAVVLLLAGAGWLRWKWAGFRARAVRRGPAVIESEFVEEE